MPRHDASEHFWDMSAKGIGPRRYVAGMTGPVMRRTAHAGEKGGKGIEALAETEKRKERKRESSAQVMNSALLAANA